jgi:hypothetical protein
MTLERLRRTLVLLLVFAAVLGPAAHACEALSEVHCAGGIVPEARVLHYGSRGHGGDCAQCCADAACTSSCPSCCTAVPTSSLYLTLGRPGLPIVVIALLETGLSIRPDPYPPRT